MVKFTKYSFVVAWRMFRKKMDSHAVLVALQEVVVHCAASTGPGAERPAWVP